MRITVRDFRLIINESINENPLKKGIAALALATSISSPAGATTTSVQGAHPPGIESLKTLSRGDIYDLIRDASQKTGVPPNLIDAMVRTESAYKPDARSRVGAVGLMQLMPATASELGVDPHNPQENVYGGALYMKKLLKMFKGDLSLAIAGYNAGPYRVKKLGRVPDIEETQKYVKRVLERMKTSKLNS